MLLIVTICTYEYLEVILWIVFEWIDILENTHLLCDNALLCLCFCETYENTWLVCLMIMRKNFSVFLSKQGRRQRKPQEWEGENNRKFPNFYSPNIFRGLFFTIPNFRSFDFPKAGAPPPLPFMATTLSPNKTSYVTFKIVAMTNKPSLSNLISLSTRFVGFSFY